MCPRKNRMVIHSWSVAKQFIILISVSLGCKEENGMMSFLPVLSQMPNCVITMLK